MQLSAAQNMQWTEEEARRMLAPLVFVWIHRRSWNGNVHAEEPGHQRQWSHDQRHHGKFLHDEIHLHSLIAQAKIDH